MKMSMKNALCLWNLSEAVQGVRRFFRLDLPHKRGIAQQCRPAVGARCNLAVLVTVLSGLTFLNPEAVGESGIDPQRLEEEQRVPMIDHERRRYIGDVWVTEELSLLEEDDPDYAIAYELMAHMSRPEERRIRFLFYPPRRISGPPLEKLLPGYRFILLYWETEILDQELLKQASVPIFHFKQLVIDPAGEVHRFMGGGGGDTRRFAEILAREGVEIRNMEDARLVWEAFCTLYQWHRRMNYDLQQVSNTIWRLGINEVDGRRYFFEVTLDEHRRIVSGRTRSEELEEWGQKRGNDTGTYQVVESIGTSPSAAAGGGLSPMGGSACF